MRSGFVPNAYHPRDFLILSHQVVKTQVLIRHAIFSIVGAPPHCRWFFAFVGAPPSGRWVVVCEAYRDEGVAPTGEVPAFVAMQGNACHL